MESLDQRVVSAQAVAEVAERESGGERPGLALVVALAAMGLFAATVILQQPAFLVAALVLLALAVWCKIQSRFLNTAGIAIIALAVVWLLLNRYWLYAGVTVLCGLLGGFVGGRKSG
jgi:hypothetical protein